MTLQVHQLGDGQGDWSGTVPEHSNLWPRHPLHRPPLPRQVGAVYSHLWPRHPLHRPPLPGQVGTVHSHLWPRYPLRCPLPGQVRAEPEHSGLAILFTALLFLGR